MRVELRLPDGTSRPATVPHEGAEHVLVDGGCPHCGETPWRVSGGRLAVGGRDYYQADAGARCCGAKVGTLRAYVSTIFGIEEDQAVLSHGRARVYP